MSQLNAAALHWLPSLYRELNHLGHFEFSGRRNGGDVSASLGYSKSLGNGPGEPSPLVLASFIYLKKVQLCFLREITEHDNMFFVLKKANLTYFSLLHSCFRSKKNKERAMLKCSLQGSPSAWQREVLRMSHREIKCACIAPAVLSIYLSKHCSCCALSRREKLCCQIHNVINS